jgi:chemotaxis response regulator CheB
MRPRGGQPCARRQTPPAHKAWVYVIVPDKSLRVEGDQLRLSEPAEPRGHRHPVDVFFVSLAEHRRERAIAIVLSGQWHQGHEGGQGERRPGDGAGSGDRAI